MIICARNQVQEKVKYNHVSHIISITDVMSENIFITSELTSIPIIHLKFDDVLEQHEKNSPTKDDVKKVLSWTKDINCTEGILVHCEAGVSRSTAMGLSILAQSFCDVDKAIQKLLEIVPEACPNPVISKFSDNILKFEGRLYQESERIASEKITKLLNS